MDSEKREKFYQNRLSRIPESHHIAIDGTLKQDNTVNHFQAIHINHA